jgi:hypothetical protein
MTNALTAAGFQLQAVEEPRPDPAVRSLDPDAWTSLTTQPRYIFFSATG